MGRGSQNTLETASSTSLDAKSTSEVSYDWDEIRKHNHKLDCWIVVNGQVYDVTRFMKTHPGGTKILHFYAGQDASEVFTAFHKEYERVGKYMKLYHKGSLKDDIGKKITETATIDNVESMSYELKRANLIKDFDKIRQVAKEMGLFEPSYFFFFMQAFQIVFLHYIAYFILWYFGAGAIPFLIAMACQIISQGQAGWTQHDYGHSSLLAKPKYNRFLQMFILGTIKGASAAWWNYMHNQHHAKPNVINKDPDVRIDPVFVLGEIEPLRKAERNAKHNEKYLYPYSWQHFYFPIAAPLLFPVYFQFMTIRYAITRRIYGDLLSMLPYYIIHFGTCIPIMGLSKTLAFFFIVKMIDSAWFTWVSQCNHIVMDIHDDDPQDTWVNLQLKATCNIEQSWFNDWFTGHLNFQIEHHLFPTMPRHNLYKVQPLILSLSKKYNLRYIIKPLGQAFLDIILSLRKSGELWEEAYEELMAGM